MAKHIVVIGPPGAGKGTVIKAMGSYGLNMVHISTGDIFSDNIKRGTPIGLMAVEYKKEGRLVPDPETITIVQERFMQIMVGIECLLDGFPRNMVQVEALIQMMRLRGDEVAMAIQVSTPHNLIVERITNRWVCKGEKGIKCGEIYNLLSKPPRVKGVCDVCGSSLYQREDDTAQAVRTRLAVYDRDTQPVVDYYREQGILWTVDGARPPHIVRQHTLFTINYALGPYGK
jgi:adenylate kinase